MPQPRFKLSPASLCDLVWGQLLSEIEAELPILRTSLAETFAACEATRTQMAYNTGSISFSTAVLLYALVRLVKPRTVFEIGTFIGNSTLAIAMAMDANGPGGTIYTCDGSNEFHLPADRAGTEIVGYSKMHSSEALRLTAGLGVKVELIHIDGRIGPADLEIISKIADQGVIIALDDFEGIEKGVVNGTQLLAHPFFAKHTLVHPPSQSRLRELAIVSRPTTALLVPEIFFVFADQ